MALGKKKKQPEIVALSAKTGKVIKRPRKGQDVNYAVRGVRGAIKIISTRSQKFYKTDFQGLNKIVSQSDKNNFIVYEQKLRKLDRDSKGRIQYRIDAAGKKHKLYQIKITYAKPRSFTKPILYKGGKKLRALDLAFKEGNYKNKKMVRDLVIVKPNTKVRKQTLTGPTIKVALANIQVDVNMKNVRKRGFGLFYNIYVVLENPAGEVQKVPVSGEFIDNEFQGTNRIPVEGQIELFGRSKVKILANLQSNMAHSIRYAMKNTGYTFTTLTTLNQIEKREWKKVAKAEAAGDEARADKISRAIPYLFFGPGQKRRLFINKATKLQALKPGYKVTMYVKFEVMDD